VSLSLSEASDAELVALALGNRQTAYRELLGRYREPVFRLIRANIGDADEALDITQEVFVSAFAALKRYDAGRPFLAWLKRIALNKCRDWARRRKVRSFFTRAARSMTPMRCPTMRPRLTCRLPIAGNCAVTADAISALPSRLREVLVLRTVEGLSQAETADVIGVNGKTVETRLYRARVKLEEILDRRNEG
jgi:DNA-directed RNA polymerase specialized sigma24 family protein